MEAFGGGWTLVTLIKKDKDDQWKPEALYPQDLATFTTAPSRVSKLSDAEINALLGKGGTRWVTANAKSTFYRMTDSAWYSNHGVKNTCGYKRNFHDAWAEPATNPVWQTSIKYIGCGAIHDGKTWNAVSGIHISGSNNQKGAHDGAWGKNGYVYARSQGLCQLDVYLMDAASVRAQGDYSWCVFDPQK